MIKMFTAARAAVVLHKLAILRFFLFSFGALAAAAQTGLAGMDWVTADPQARVMVIIGIFSSWTISMMAFLDRSMSRIAQGENPFSEPGTTPGRTVNDTGQEPKP